ncbi:MAG: hypothetical protein LBL26_03495 [Peptococcaceae bacterium]|nr:hypothetical protein [Peptococcaceae bacterium]
MNMKRMITTWLCLSLSFAMFPFSALASVGDPNVDSGGGGMGSGTSSSFWNPGNDGVRITVVDANTGAAVSSPVDFSNKEQPSSLLHFGNTNKLDYLAGASLSLETDTGYQYHQPAYAMPTIVSSSGQNNIDAVRNYFSSEYAAMMVAETASIDYDRLIGGEYKLFIEPVAYFTYDNDQYCMTATEAALYDQLADGDLYMKLSSLTHQNLSLAMFLEDSDLGLPAFDGSATGRQTTETILSSLGMGIVSYGGAPREPPEPIEPGETSVDYRVHTEVVTAVTLSTADEINPDSPATVRFYINGATYTVNSIVIPAGGSQLVWAKWTTPAAEQTMTLTVSANMGTLSANTITAKIVDLNRNPPPDPKATDRNDGFTAPPIPSKTQITSASWSVWWARWHPNWVWIEYWVTYTESYDWTDDDGNTHSDSYSYSVDEGWWEDQGWWDYFTDNYSASLSAASVVAPDEKVPTANGKLMKSGYGVNNQVTARFTTGAPASHVAAAQTAVSYFPEFRYDTYWRLLERTSGTYMAQLEFRQNSFSTYNRRAHFVPVWYPDGTYTVYTWLLDAWTPAGMLSVNLTDYVTIQESLFDDWYTNRE